jgi:hypothetical protein
MSAPPTALQTRRGIGTSGLAHLLNRAANRVAGLMSQCDATFKRAHESQTLCNPLQGSADRFGELHVSWRRRTTGSRSAIRPMAKRFEANQIAKAQVRPEAVRRGSQHEVRQWPDADRRLRMIERE